MRTRREEYGRNRTGQTVLICFQAEVIRKFAKKKSVRSFLYKRTSHEWDSRVPEVEGQVSLSLPSPRPTILFLFFFFWRLSRLEYVVFTMVLFHCNYQNLRPCNPREVKAAVAISCITKQRGARTPKPVLYLELGKNADSG